MISKTQAKKASRYFLLAFFVCMPFLDFAQSKFDTWFLSPNTLLRFRNNTVTSEFLNNTLTIDDTPLESSCIIDSAGKIIIMVDERNIYDSLGTIIQNYNTCPSDGLNFNQTSMTPILPFGKDKYIFFNKHCEDTVFYYVVNKTATNTFEVSKAKKNKAYLDATKKRSEWSTLGAFYSTSSHGTSNCSGIRTYIRSDDGLIGMFKTDTSENNITFDILKLTNLVAPAVTYTTIEGFNFSNDNKKLLTASDTYLNLYEYNDVSAKTTFIKKILIPSNIFTHALVYFIFSPNDKFVYLQGSNFFGLSGLETILYQLNLETEVFKKINSYEVKVGSADARNMQIGIDEKIYITDNRQYLSVIHQPDLPYPACNYESKAIKIEAGGWTVYPPRKLENYYNRKYDFKITQTCIGDSVLFEGPKMASDDKYIWRFADGFTTTATGVKRHISQEQKIHLRYNYCDVYDTARVHPPKPKPIKDTVLCALNNFVLPKVLGIEYIYFSRTITGSAINVFNGNNYITLKNNCYLLSDTFNVKVLQRQAKPFGTDSVICHQDEATLLAKAPADYSLAWSDGSSEKSLKITQNGTYSLVRKNQCFADTSSITVTFVDATDISKISNVFTPNGDGINDTWLPFTTEKVSDFELKIYSRWGSLVHQTTNQNEAWSASGQPDGIYFYSISYTDCNKKPQSLKGTLQVIR